MFSACSRAHHSRVQLKRVKIHLFYVSSVHGVKKIPLDWLTLVVKCGFPEPLRVDPLIISLADSCCRERSHGFCGAPTRAPMPPLLYSSRKQAAGSGSSVTWTSCRRCELLDSVEATALEQDLASFLFWLFTTSSLTPWSQRGLVAQLPPQKPSENTPSACSDQSSY